MKLELKGLPKEQAWMTCMVHVAERSRWEVLEGNTEFSDAELRLVIHEEVLV